MKDNGWLGLFIIVLLLIMVLVFGLVSGSCRDHRERNIAIQEAAQSVADQYGRR